ncbi:MAG: hypothetical protein COB66_02985 [Coxiella sp. (in: Bacteria)]|nr:MAG: hypothetical protein COB66_02985 [Coxiella sp. (in: g-proteobacteria)]
MSGDFQGNVLYAIHMLVLQGVITISDEGYDRLQQIYFERGGLTPDTTEAFIAVMQAEIMLENPDRAVSFSGDIFFDRGLSDWLMLHFLMQLQDGGLQTVIQFSNHDYGLFDYLFADGIAAAIRARVQARFQRDYDAELLEHEAQLAAEGDADDIFGAVYRQSDPVPPNNVASKTEGFMSILSETPGKYFDATSNLQGRSGLSLMKMIEADEYPGITKARCQELVQKYVLPNLQLVTIIYDEKSGTLSDATHGIICFETYKKMAISLGVMYHDNNPAAFIESIERINEAWQKQCLSGELPSILPADELELLYTKWEIAARGISADLLPCFRSGHARHDKSIFSIDEKGEIESLPMREYQQLMPTPLDLLDVPKTLKAQKEQIDNMVAWKSITYVKYHGHESFLASPEQIAALDAVPLGKDRQLSDEYLALRAAFIAKTPGQSCLQMNPAAPAPYLDRVKTVFKDYDRVNLDSSDRGREGHPSVATKKLAKTVYFAVAPGRVLAPRPAHVDESRAACIKHRHYQLKRVLLRELLSFCVRELEALPVEIKQKGICVIKSDDAQTTLGDQCDVIRAFLRGASAFSRLPDKLVGADDRDVASMIMACGFELYSKMCDAVHRLMPKHVLSKTLYTHYSPIKGLLNAAMDLPRSHQLAYLEEMMQKIAAGATGTQRRDLIPPIMPPIVPSIWLTPAAGGEPDCLFQLKSAS